MVTSQIPLNSTSQECNCKDFTCIPLSVFQLESIFQVNLYCDLAGCDSPVLYRSASIPISVEDIEELRRKGHRALYVSNSDFNTLNQVLNDSLAHVSLR